MTDLLDEAGLTPPPSRYTERDMLNALHARYSQRSQGDLARYVCAEHVRAFAGVAGYGVTPDGDWHSRTMRTADFIAQDTWEAQGLLLHGHEVKVSRADWLTELADPSKADAIKRCDRAAFEGQLSAGVEAQKHTLRRRVRKIICAVKDAQSSAGRVECREDIIRETYPLVYTSEDGRIRIYET